jgi:hypothetical protein
VIKHSCVDLVTTLDKRVEHWTRELNTGQERQTLDKRVKHWTRESNTGQESQTVQIKKYGTASIREPTAAAFINNNRIWEGRPM